MHNRTDCICLIFLHCTFSNVSSNGLPEKRHSRIGCICLNFLHCAFSNVSANRLPEWMQSHTGCICLAFLQCGFSKVSSNGLHEKMHNHTSCNCLIFPFVHWQLFHWCSSAWNDQAQEFVQSPQVGKLCHQNQDLLVRPGYNFAQLFRDIPEAIAHLIPKSDN